MAGGRCLGPAQLACERRRGLDTPDNFERCPASEAPNTYERCLNPDTCDRCPDFKVPKRCLDADPTNIRERWLGPDLPNTFFTPSESLNICSRCPQSKVSNTCERCHELPDDRGRCPNLPGARKWYPGHEDLRRRSHLENKVEATRSQCIRGRTQTNCETLPSESKKKKWQL